MRFSHENNLFNPPNKVHIVWNFHSNKITHLFYHTQSNKINCKKIDKPKKTWQWNIVASLYITLQVCTKLRAFMAGSIILDIQAFLLPKYQNQCNCPHTQASMCHAIHAVVVRSLAPTAHIHESFCCSSLYKRLEVKLMSLCSWRFSECTWQTLLC